MISEAQQYVTSRGLPDAPLVGRALLLLLQAKAMRCSKLRFVLQRLRLLSFVHQRLQ
jgi:hypothetical protein